VDKVVEVVMTEDRGKCTKQFARIVKRNVKSRLNQGKTVRFIARIVFQSIKTAAADLRFCRFLKARQPKPWRAFFGMEKQMKLKSIFLSLMILDLFTAVLFAQEHQSTNDTVTKMKIALNLSDSQVADITQVIDRYTDASNELQKSIDDGTVNQSAVDSQKEQLKAVEEQGIAQYLRSDQLSQWNMVQGQMDRQKGDDSSDSGTGSDEYSNLPRNNPS
jgi:hypothetical protein